MPDSDITIDWLKLRLTNSFISEVWIFGSSVCQPRTHNDIDVFIKYKDGYSAMIPILKRNTQDEFVAQFGIPLHFLALSLSESIEVAQFLENALSGGVRVR